MARFQPTPLYNQPARDEDCIVCRYPRRGIAPDHECPECGAPHGPGWIYFIPDYATALAANARPSQALSWVQIVGGMFVILLTTVVQRGPRATFGYWQGGAFVLIGVVALVVQRRLLNPRRRTHQHALAISDDEFAVIENMRLKARYRLSEMTGLRVDPQLGNAILFQVEGRGVRLAHGKYLGHSYPRIQNFADCLKSAVQAAQAKPPHSPAPQ